MALQHLLLGLISIAPRSGYDLYKAFDHLFSGIWGATKRQIYHALDAIHEAGWADVELVEQTHYPDKKVYHLTEAGLAELRHWLITPQPPQPPRQEWLGQLFFGSAIEPIAFIPILEARIQLLQSAQASLKGHFQDLRRAMQRPLYPHLCRMITIRLKLVEYAIRRNLMELEWLNDSLTMLRELNQYPSEDTSIAEQIIKSIEELGFGDART